MKTNYDHYKKQVDDVHDDDDEFAIDEDNKIIKCLDITCDNCKFSRRNTKQNCEKSKIEWLFAEYQEPITEKEQMKNYG